MSKIEMIPFSKFFTYCTGFEKFLYYFGLFAGIIAGAFVPSLGIIIGEITVTFDPDLSNSEINREMSKIFIGTQILGVIIWLFCYFYFAFWQHVAENVTFSLRTRYIHTLLKQEAKYFESLKVESIPS